MLAAANDTEEITLVKLHHFDLYRLLRGGPREADAVAFPGGIIKNNNILRLIVNRGEFIELFGLHITVFMIQNRLAWSEREKEFSQWKLISNQR